VTVEGAQSLDLVVGWVRQPLRLSFSEGRAACPLYRADSGPLGDLTSATRPLDGDRFGGAGGGVPDTGSVRRVGDLGGASMSIVLKGQKQRRLLAALLVDANRSITAWIS
jgi:hypothetical protein